MSPLHHCAFIILILVVVSPWSVATPLPAVGTVSYQQHSPIVIKGNSDFTTANGVTGGTGTASDPFIIEGWQINASAANGITIVDTTDFLVIRNVMIHSGLRGVVLSRVAHATLQFAAIWDNTQTGVLVEKSSEISLSDNNVTKNGCCFIPTQTVTLGPGILLDRSSNLVASANSVTSNRGEGFFLNSTTSIKIESSAISRNGGTGIFLRNANATTVSQNAIDSNSDSGVAMRASFALTLTGNAFTMDGISLDLVFQDAETDQELESLSISSDNTVDGKPIYYYKDCKGLDVEGISVGQIFVYNCDGVRLSGLTLQNSETGIFLWRVHGLMITHSSFSATMGVALYASSYVSIVANNFTNIQFTSNQGSYIFPGSALFLLNVNNITVTANTFENDRWGIRSYSQGGYSTYDGLVYHNNFVNVVSCCDVLNPFGWSWDSGYPRGGNYYSDYTSVDNCSGPSQNICPDPDGIWDIQNVNVTMDRFPLTQPYLLPSDATPPSWSQDSTLTASNIGTASLRLNWSPAADDVEVIAYRISQGGTIVAYVPGRFHSYEITGLSPGATYTFQVEAVDAAGNWSGTSLSVTASTSGLGPILFYSIVVVLVAVSLIVVLRWYSMRRERQKGTAATGGS